MDRTSLQQELRQRLARIAKLQSECPDLMGFEQAYWRDNITTAEFEEVKARIEGCDRAIAEETARVEQLRALLGDG